MASTDKIDCCLFKKVPIRATLLIVALIGCALNFAFAFGTCWLDQVVPHQPCIIGTFYTIAAVFYFSLLCSRFVRGHRHILPFIVYLALFLVLNAFVCLGLLIALGKATTRIAKQNTDFRLILRRSDEPAISNLLLLTFSSLLLNCALYLIARRTYQRLVREGNSDPQLLDATSTHTSHTQRY